MWELGRIAVVAVVILLVISYAVAWDEITARRTSMSNANRFIIWSVAAFVGVVSTLLAFVGIIRDGLDVYGWVGFALYAFGELAWSYAIKYTDERFEPVTLFITSFGLVLWATATTTDGIYWTLPVIISAVYHVFIDLCWYMSFHATHKNGSIMTTKAAKFAAWSGYLAMLHYAFASFITVENMRATDTFTPDIRLTYNRWVRDESSDSCSDSECVVFPVYTNYGTIDIGIVVAFFSWISGTNHAITYIGLHCDWEFMYEQVGLAEKNKGHYGNVIRTLDWTFSASLMMAVNLFLYETPGNITSLLTTMAATGLVMLVGWSSEMLHGLGDGWQRGKWYLYAGAFALFTLLWVPLMWILGILQRRPHNERYEFNGRMTTDDMQSPPIEVYFFIGWLVATFFIFPIVHFFKLWGPPDAERSFKYEIWFAVLSFWSKLPLLAVFYGGILSRRNTIEAYKVELWNTTDSLFNMTSVEREADSSRVYMSIGIGIAVSFISAFIMIFCAFRTDLGICVKSQKRYDKNNAGMEMLIRN
jgi:hypothetical protein